MHIPAVSTVLPWKAGSDIYQSGLSCLCLASLNHSHIPFTTELCPSPSSLGLILIFYNLMLDQSPNHGLLWWLRLWADSGCISSQVSTDALCSTYAEPPEQRSLLQICSLSRGWSAESQLTQDGPHCWSGMMVYPQRHQESAVGTVHVLPQWSAEQQPHRKLPGSSHSRLVMCHSRDTQVVKRQGESRHSQIRGYWGYTETS